MKVIELKKILKENAADVKEFQKKTKGIGPKIADKIQIIIDTGEYPLKFVGKIMHQLVGA